MKVSSDPRNGFVYACLKRMFSKFGFSFLHALRCHHLNEIMLTLKNSAFTSANLRIDVNFDVVVTSAKRLSYVRSYIRGSSNKF